MTHRVAHLTELRTAEGWAGIRRELGVSAFGINAWTAGEDGATIIAEHAEAQSGQEEVYLVLEGQATFTLDGEEVDGPAGTIVHVSDPTVRRGATGTAGTTILVVGAKPGEAYTVTGWETNADIFPLFGCGEFGKAKELLEAALAEYPGQATMLYNLACAEARLGDSAAALARLQEAVATNATFAGYAQNDDDLASIRDEPGFPAAPEEAVV